VQRVHDEEEQARSFYYLAPQLPDELLPELVDAVIAMTERIWYRESVFVVVADRLDAPLIERVLNAKFDHRGGEWTQACAARFEAADAKHGTPDKVGLAAALAQLGEGRRMLRGDLVTQYMTLDPAHVPPAVASALADVFRAAGADGFGGYAPE
jgi:hypothetical protein